MSATLALNDAELRDDLSPAVGYGFAGDRLPFSAPVSASFALDQEFRLDDTLKALVGGLVSYSGNRKGMFPSTLPDQTPIRNELRSYTVLNLHSGVIYADWRVSLYANNVGDERGIVAGGPRGSEATLTAAYGYFVVRPRTYGVSFAKDF